MTPSPPPISETAPPPLESPSPASSSRARLLVSILVAAIVTAGLLAWLRPGRSDLPSRTITGMEAPDDGYWTSPLRRVAGTGRQDAFDERLALSLTLPENALGALAWRLGVPASDARFAGSALALFATVLAALLLGGVVPVFFLLFLLASPPILGHFRADLGEGTAFGLVSLFGLAIVRGRVGLAAFVAGVGIFQKACGLPLGVGVLAAVLVGPGRAAKFGKASLGAALGVALCAAIATLAFGDDPIGFVVRPFAATHDTGGGVDSKSFLLRAAFSGAYDLGFAFVWIGAAAWVAVPHRRASPAVVTALLAGFAFAALFPDPWRSLPTWMLLPALLGEPRGATGAESRFGRAGRVVSAYLVVEAVLAAAAQSRGHTPGPLTLLVLAALFLGLDLWRSRHAADPSTALMLCTVLGAISIIHLPPTSVTSSPTTERLDLAQRVAARLPADAHLVGYSFLASSFRGTLYYPPFQSLWEHELTVPTAPATLYRIRSADATTPPPAGYVFEKSESLGVVPYGRRLEPGTVVLETLVRR